MLPLLFPCAAPTQRAIQFASGPTHNCLDGCVANPHLVDGDCTKMWDLNCGCAADSSPHSPVCGPPAVVGALCNAGTSANLSCQPGAGQGAYPDCKIGVDIGCGCAINEFLPTEAVQETASGYEGAIMTANASSFLLTPQLAHCAPVEQIPPCPPGGLVSGDRINISLPCWPEMPAKYNCENPSVPSPYYLPGKNIFVCTPSWDPNCGCGSDFSAAARLVGPVFYSEQVCKNGTRPSNSCQPGAGGPGGYPDCKVGVDTGCGCAKDEFPLTFEGGFLVPPVSSEMCAEVF